MDLHAFAIPLSIVLGFIGNAWYLSGRLQRIEDQATATAKAFDRHCIQDREDFARVHDRIDRKADRHAVGLPAVN